MESKLDARANAYCAGVNSRLAIASESMHPSVSAVVNALISGPGKSLRPRLLAASAGFPPHWNDDHLTLGAVVELIHIGSLLHDDIIDRAARRRGMPTAFATLGPETAALAGASCFAMAGNILSGFRSDLVQAVATTMDDLADGELRDVERAFDLTLDEANYIELVSAKTGALFGLCCRLGAMLEVDPTLVDSFARFGVGFGSAFQILDDCLDFAISDLGKPVGTDVRLGLFGLPVLFAANSKSDRTAASNLVGRLHSLHWDDHSHAEVRRLVVDLGGLDQSLQVADRIMVATARDLLDRQDGPQSRGLIDLAETAYWKYRHEAA